MFDPDSGQHHLPIPIAGCLPSCFYCRTRKRVSFILFNGHLLAVWKVSQVNLKYLKVFAFFLAFQIVYFVSGPKKSKLYPVNSACHVHSWSSPLIIQTYPGSAFMLAIVHEHPHNFLRYAPICCHLKPESLPTQSTYLVKHVGAIGKTMGYSARPLCGCLYLLLK